MGDGVGAAQGTRGLGGAQRMSYLDQVKDDLDTIGIRPGSNRVSEAKMGQILDLPSVKADPAAFVEKVLLPSNSGFDFDVDARALGALSGALGAAAEQDPKKAMRLSAAFEKLWNAAAGPMRDGVPNNPLLYERMTNAYTEAFTTGTVAPQPPPAPVPPALQGTISKPPGTR